MRAPSKFADGHNEWIDALALAGAAPALVSALGSQDIKVVTPAMRALSNMLTGSDQATQAVLDAGFLARLAPLFRSPKLQLLWAVDRVFGARASGDANSTSGVLPPLPEELNAANAAMHVGARSAVPGGAFT